MIRATLAIILALYPAGVPASAAQVRTAAIGCKSVASVERLQALRTAAEQDDYRESLGKLVRAGECRSWEPGEQVVSKDKAEGLACFAPKGSSICYWSTSAMVD